MAKARILSSVFILITICVNEVSAQQYTGVDSEGILQVKKALLAHADDMIDELGKNMSAHYFIEFDIAENKREVTDVISLTKIDSATMSMIVRAIHRADRRWDAQPGLRRYLLPIFIEYLVDSDAHGEKGERQMIKESAGIDNPYATWPEVGSFIVLKPLFYNATLVH